MRHPTWNVQGVGARITAVVTVPLLALVAVTVLAGLGLGQMHDRTETLYADRVVPLTQLKSVSDDYAVHIVDAVSKAHAGVIGPEEALATVTEARARIADTWAAYLALPKSAEEQSRVDQAEARFAPVDTALDQLEEAAGDDPEQAFADADPDGQLYRSVDSLIFGIGELIAYHQEQAELDRAAAASAYERVRNQMVLLSLVFLVAAVALAIVVGRGIVVPLHRTVRVLDKVADGDLTARLNTSARGEVGRMGRALDRAVDTMATTVHAIIGTAGALAASSEQLSATSQQMGATAEETSAQANAVATAAQQVSSNVATVATGAEEMGASIREIAMSASEASRVAASAAQAVGTTSTTVGHLAVSSSEIGEVVKLITSIAAQTNLLALNATIEAARAGDAGRGFAVVANEVKELALQTTGATGDISARIAAIQADAGATEAAIAEIAGVIDRINEIQDSIASAVEEQTATTNEISRNISEAAAGAGEIASGIGTVADAAHETAGGAGQTRNAAGELAGMADQLADLVQRFRVEDVTAAPEVAQEPVDAWDGPPDQSDPTEPVDGDDSAEQDRPDHRPEPELTPVG